MRLLQIIHTLSWYGFHKYWEGRVPFVNIIDKMSGLSEGALLLGVFGIL